MNIIDESSIYLMGNFGFSYIAFLWWILSIAVFGIALFGDRDTGIHSRWGSVFIVGMNHHAENHLVLTIVSLMGEVSKFNG